MKQRFVRPRCSNALKHCGPRTSKKSYRSVRRVSDGNVYEENYDWRIFSKEHSKMSTRWWQGCRVFVITNKSERIWRMRKNGDPMKVKPLSLDAVYKAISNGASKDCLHIDN